LLGSVWAAGLVRGLLYEVSPLDPLTIVLVALVLLAAGAAAAAVPALRATRIDPATALGRS
jgi:putative ABC transport system permease protein